jgi:hypothetical protein
VTFPDVDPREPAESPGQHEAAVHLRVGGGFFVTTERSSAMGAAENRAKSSAMAAHMKALGITRTTSQCPWGCGAAVRNGGEALLNHLNACRGGGAKKLARLNNRR